MQTASQIAASQLQEEPSKGLLVPLPPHPTPHVKWAPAHSLQCPHSPGDTISTDLNSFPFRLASVVLLYSLPNHKGILQMVGSSSGLRKFRESLGWPA